MPEFISLRSGAIPEMTPSNCHAGSTWSLKGILARGQPVASLVANIPPPLGRLKSLQKMIAKLFLILEFVAVNI
jgi:hypothetical protein